MMNRLIVVLMLGLSSLLFAQTWTVQNPLPTEAYLYNVCTVTEQNIIIGGLGGTLLKSYDAGNTWITQKIKELENIRKICFTDSLNGWLIDSFYLYQTTDGGETWKNVNISNMVNIVDFTDYYLTDLFCFHNKFYLFLKPQTAVVDELIGITSIVLESSDYGKTWKKQEQQLNGKFLCAHFLNESTGYVYTEVTVSLGESYNLCYLTRDGGLSWNSFQFPVTYFTTSIYFINSGTGFVGKYRSPNGGNTWENVFPALEESESINDMYFTDNLNGWAISDFRIFQTHDAGETWKPIEKEDAGKLVDIVFSPSQNGWIVGGDGTIFRKMNTNANWEYLSRGHRTALRDVFFIDENTGWCVGDKGYILHTQNSGDNWEKLNVPVDNILFKVIFLNHLDGWVAGNNVLLRTTDGGKKWSVLINNSKCKFVDIAFFDDNTGLLIDYWGNIYRTINGGGEWELLAESPVFLTSIEIVNEQEAWIGGWFGLMHMTEKGDVINWYDVPELNKVLDIQFVNTTTGFLMTEYGTLFKTINGGWDWIEMARGNGVEDDPIQAFRMIDNTNGWIYSDKLGGAIKNIYTNSIMIQTDIEQYKVPTIRAFSFVNENLGWAVGLNSAILKYSNANDTPIFPGLEKSKQHVHVFPNPFREQQYIIFKLGQRQLVKIDIYNLLGEKIESVHNDYLNEGIQVLRWSNEYASGVYFITVKCDEFVETCKSTTFH